MDKNNVDFSLLISGKADPILISVLKSDNLDLSDAKFITKPQEEKP